MKLFIAILLFAAPFAQADISVFPGSINFFQVPIGGIGQSQSVYVYNTGSESTNIRVQDYCFGDFRVMSWCNLGVNAGGSCRIDITFAPYRTGYQNCTLYVQGDEGAPKSVSVSGQGVER